MKGRDIILILVVGLIAWIFLFRGSSILGTVSPTSNASGTATPPATPATVGGVVQSIANVINSLGSAPQGSAKTL